MSPLARTIPLTTFVILAFSSASALRAQSPAPWNRKFEAVAVTPIPNDRAGRYGIQPFFRVEAGPTSAPLNLSTEVEIRVNGATAGRLAFGIFADPAAAAGCNVPCHEMGQVCVCIAGTPICSCETVLVCDPPFPTALMPGDEIAIILYPAPGALPDAEASDDGFRIAFDGRPIVWDRRIARVDVTPARLAPGRAVDVHVELDALASYEGVLDLDAEVAVLVNGEPSTSGHSASDDITWVSCGMGCTGGTCSHGGAEPGQCVMEPNEGGPMCYCSSQGYGVVDFRGVAAVPGDEITVIIYPAPGTVPDTMGDRVADRRSVIVERPSRSSFRRGDSNSNGSVDMADAVFALSWLFAGGRTPGCLDAADANDDGTVDIGDPISVLNWLFLGGPTPRRPGPFACGEDPTADGLGDCVQDACGGET